MAWGQPSTRTKPYTADYNRAYDTHTPGITSREFAVNPPNRADEGPDNISGINTDRRYVMPSWSVYDNEDPNSHNYLGDEVGPREIQTGNAPSGGYSTLPGNGFAPHLDGVIFPDLRRSGAYRPTDYEVGEVAHFAERDRDRIKRRAEAGVSEDFSPPKRLRPSDPIHAVEHSPIEKEWSENHSLVPGAEAAPTVRSNPNPWFFWKDWDKSDVYRGSGARYLNGTHYSMAEHNTLNPSQPSVNGSTPRRDLRNTYRMDPQPWDAEITDSANNTPGYGVGTVGSGAYGTSFRL